MDDLGGILQTAKDYFADALAATRQERVFLRLKDLGIQEHNTSMAINLAQVAAVAHLSNEDQAIHHIHDILKACNQSKIKCFTDNVILQVVERCYVGSESSITFILPEFVGQLSNEEHSSITAEDHATLSMRAETKTRLEWLKKALALAENKHV